MKLETARLISAREAAVKQRVQAVVSKEKEDKIRVEKENEKKELRQMFMEDKRYFQNEAKKREEIDLRFKLRIEKMEKKNMKIKEEINADKGVVRDGVFSLPLIQSLSNKKPHSSDNKLRPDLKEDFALPPILEKGKI
jgi:hypothetical protein